MLETLFGGLAAAIGVSISLPQIWKTHKTKQAADVSVAMWVLLFLGQVCWMAYALLRSDTILLLANIAAFTQTCIMLFLIRRYR